MQGIVFRADVADWLQRKANNYDAVQQHDIADCFRSAADEWSVDQKDVCCPPHNDDGKHSCCQHQREQNGMPAPEEARDGR